MTVVVHNVHNRGVVRALLIQKQVYQLFSVNGPSSSQELWGIRFQAQNELADVIVNIC